MKTTDQQKIESLIPKAIGWLKVCNDEAYVMAKMYGARDSETSIHHIDMAIGQAKISLNLSKP